MSEVNNTQILRRRIQSKDLAPPKLEVNKQMPNLCLQMYISQSGNKVDSTAVDTSKGMDESQFEQWL